MRLPSVFFGQDEETLLLLEVHLRSIGRDVRCRVSEIVAPMPLFQLACIVFPHRSREERSIEVAMIPSKQIQPSKLHPHKRTLHLCFNPSYSPLSVDVLLHQLSHPLCQIYVGRCLVRKQHRRAVDTSRAERAHVGQVVPEPLDYGGEIVPELAAHDQVLTLGLPFERCGSVGGGGACPTALQSPPPRWRLIFSAAIVAAAANADRIRDADGVLGAAGFLDAAPVPHQLRKPRLHSAHRTSFVAVVG
mmetsp:Transcript_10488/g.30860  ORF Transcript_10488/g.30860 Transcript_10488/m.30860 type:complete len:247 (-) Transcript_10488:730-1470(-)